MDLLVGLIKKELNEMVDSEIDYIKDLWQVCYKIKDDLTKDEILDIANCYINILTDKIQKINYTATLLEGTLKERDEQIEQLKKEIENLTK